MARRGRKRPSVKSRIERDVRRKFVKDAVKMAPSLKPWRIRSPQTSELGYAKKPKKPLVWTVRDSAHRWVETRPLKKGERFDIHTHSEHSSISMGDVAFFVEQVMKHGDVIHVISEVREESARNTFRRLARRELGELWNRYGGMPPEEEVKNVVTRVAREASERLMERGRVVLMPTKNLLNMPDEEKNKLIEYALSRDAHDFSHGQKAYVTRKFGKLFRIRYVPAEGYTY